MNPVRRNVPLIPYFVKPCLKKTSLLPSITQAVSCRLLSGRKVKKDPIDQLKTIAITALFGGFCYFIYKEAEEQKKMEEIRAIARAIKKMTS